MLSTDAGMESPSAWAAAVGRRGRRLPHRVRCRRADAAGDWAVQFPEPNGLALGTAIAYIERLKAAAPIVGFGPTGGTGARERRPDGRRDRRADVGRARRASRRSLAGHPTNAPVASTASSWSTPVATTSQLDRRRHPPPPRSRRCPARPASHRGAEDVGPISVPAGTQPVPSLQNAPWPTPAARRRAPCRRPLRGRRRPGARNRYPRTTRREHRTQDGPVHDLGYRDVEGAASSLPVHLPRRGRRGRAAGRRFGLGRLRGRWFGRRLLGGRLGRCLALRRTGVGRDVQAGRGRHRRRLRHLAGRASGRKATAARGDQDQRRIARTGRAPPRDAGRGARSIRALG